MVGRLQRLIFTFKFFTSVNIFFASVVRFIPFFVFRCLVMVTKNGKNQLSSVCLFSV